MKPVTAYTDFRAYLGDWVEERKAQGLPGSNRWFAMKMGINSTSWLTSILKGAKGLSKQTTKKLSEILKHSPIESRYFETLISFNQARSIDERNQFYRELSAIQKLKDVRTVSTNHYEYYSTWYNSAVRSLVGMYQFKAEPADWDRLGAMVSPAITQAQARKSLELLEELGFVKKNASNIYELTDSAVTSGENTKSLAIANFQQETMRLAQEALDRFPRDNRYIGTETVGVSEKTFQQIKQVLIDTRTKIAELANADAEADQVYQVNLQAFPMSKKEKISHRGTEKDKGE